MNRRGEYCSPASSVFPNLAAKPTSKGKEYHYQLPEIRGGGPRLSRRMREAAAISMFSRSYRDAPARRYEAATANKQNRGVSCGGPG